MPYKKEIISLLVCCVACFCGHLFAQETTLPPPLKYQDNVIADFGFGLDLEPAVMPNGDLLFSVSLLGNGMYHSKYIGKAANGALTYQCPERLTDFSLKYGMPKVLHIDGIQPDFFMTDKSTGRWLHFDYSPQQPLTVSNPIAVTVNGSNLTGDFTIINNSEGTFLLKNSKINDGTSYWPGGKSPWGYPPNPQIGFNKGYDANGVWLGDKGTVVINYAKLIDKENWKFGPFKQLTMNGEVFKLNMYGGIRLSTVEMQQTNEQQLLVFSDIEHFSLFDLRMENGSLALVQKQFPQGFSEIPNSIYGCSSATSTKPVSSSAQGFIVGGNPGILIEYYTENGLWKERPVLMKGGDLYVQTLAVPNYIDWDGDGKPDIISGDASGYIWFFKNTGSSDVPVWQPGVKLMVGTTVIHHLAGMTGSIQGPNERRWGYTQPLVVDWDGDGLLDIVCNDITGKYVVYKNVGTKTNPALASASQIQFKGEQFKAAWRSKPALMPHVFSTNANLPSMLAINGEGILCWYQRDKATPNILLKEQPLSDVDGLPIRIVGFAGHEGRATLSICDVNKDGVWDILFGQGVHMYQSRVVKNAKNYSTAYVLINVGTNENPRFDLPRSVYQSNGEAINLDRHGCWVSPILDDKAQLVDLLAGGEDGKFYLFKNPVIYLDTTPISETNPNEMGGSTGKIEIKYKDLTVTYTTVRAKDGNIWLQQNLGAVRVAQTGGDVAAFGDFFSWGRWDDGHQYQNTTYNGVPAPNNPTGLNAQANNPFYWHATGPYWWATGTVTDTWAASSPMEVTDVNGCDPCRKLLGVGWKVPTEAEFNALKTAEGITDRATAFSSNLKIPYTKYASATGENTFFSAGTRIWTSTASNNGAAKYLNLPSDGTSASFGAASRAGGYTLRCIKLNAKPLITTPVGFINFKGKNGLGGVSLAWTIASEHNNASYTVQHSPDGVLFKDIATMLGKGNTSVQQTYTYLHQNPALGNNYYKLLQTDFDGTQRELTTIMVAVPNLEKEKTVVSTADNEVKIALTGFDSKAKKVVISAISGEIIYTGIITENNTALPLTLKKGVYIAQIEFENYVVKAVKFLK